MTPILLPVLQVLLLNKSTSTSTDINTWKHSTLCGHIIYPLTRYFNWCIEMHCSSACDTSIQQNWYLYNVTDSDTTKYGEH